MLFVHFVFWEIFLYFFLSLAHTLVLLAYHITSPRVTQNNSLIENVILYFIIIFSVLKFFLS